MSRRDEDTQEQKRLFFAGHGTGGAGVLARGTAMRCGSESVSLEKIAMSTRSCQKERQYPFVDFIDQ